MLTPGQRIYSASFSELTVLFDLYADSDRHAALLLNRALSRSREDNNWIDARTICSQVTSSGTKIHEEIRTVLEAYNILYGYSDDKLIPGVCLDSCITDPDVPPSVTKEDVVTVTYRVNHYKLHDHRQQVDFRSAYAGIDRNPDLTTYIFMDDVGTPRQRDIRISPNHDAVPRKSKTVQTTNGVICTKEGVYYLCASSTDEMCMLIRGFLLKNHLLENRNLVCFSDGAKTIWSNYDKWFKCFSKRRLFVDWHHLVKKSNELFTRILKSDKKYEKEIIEIKRIYFGILWSGNILGARDYLWEIPAKYIKAGRSVDLLADYLQSKMDHHSIACFAVRKQLKQINASSRAETANCSMTTSRQKKQGKSWSEDGSHAKTNWRNVYANNEAANIVNGRPLRLSLKNDVDRHRAMDENLVKQDKSV